MSLVGWFYSWLSHRGRALAEYRSGMKKADKHDYRGAITDYTAVIEGKDTPEDLKTMAIYNRALAYSAIHEDEMAANDLDQVLSMPKVSERVKTAVLRRRERIRQRAEKNKISDS
jgi:tetratricopeptide (TPR) repeat protein